MSRVSALRFIDGVGIEGDLAARASSPRQVLLVGADDLDALEVGYEALRANIVLDSVRQLLSGDVLRVGSTWLRITIGCEACSRLNDASPGLSKRAGSRRGVLARVLSDGDVFAGDAVMHEGTQLRALSVNWHERVAEIMRAVPAGNVVTYAALAEVAGVQATYCRALPAVLRKAASSGIPGHRAVSSSSIRDDELVRCWHGDTFHSRDEATFRDWLRGFARCRGQSKA